jgi:mono/diheme cytochrome c family protein
MRTLSIAILIATSALQAADATAGKAIYEKHCMSCHGPQGAAAANVAKFVEGRMVDLRSARVQAMSTADMTKVLAEGKGKMKATPAVPAAQIDNLTAYIHELKG